jgi:hypothetical protein
MKTLIKNTGIAAAIIVGLFLSSCKKNNGDVAPVDTNASVQLVNASPDAGPANLYIMDSLRSSSNVAYATASGYRPTPSSDVQTIKIKSATGAVLASGTSGFIAQSKYSLFLTGQVRDNNLAVLESEDDTTDPAAGNVKVKFVNTVSNTPLVDLTANDVAAFSGQGYKAVTKYKEMAAGAYIFKLRISGTSTNAVTMPSVTLTSGKIYTIYTKNLIVNNNTVFDAAIIANN